MSRFKQLFDGLFGDSPDQARDSERDQSRVELAAAVLMTEVARSDFSVDDAERAVMQEALQEQFHLSASDAESLLETADTKAADGTSTYDYLSTINDKLQYQDKLLVLTALWRVAYADGVLEKHEEALMRKFGDLLYVPHRDWIQLKLKIAESSGVSPA